MPKKFMGKCSTSLVIRELKITTTTICHLTFVRVTIFLPHQSEKLMSSGRCGEIETLVQYWWECTMA